MISRDELSITLTTLWHPLHGALPLPYVPVRITRLLAAEPRSTAGTLFLCEYHRRTILQGDPVSDGVGLAGLIKSKAYAFLLA